MSMGHPKGSMGPQRDSDEDAGVRSDTGLDKRVLISLNVQVSTGT